MSKVLILDDMQERHNGFKAMLLGHQLTHAYTCQQFISALSRDTYDTILLDHDLGQELDGRDAVAWLGKNLDRCPNKILIHSWNAYCADEMEEMLKSFPGNRLIINRPFVVYCEVPMPDWWTMGGDTKEASRIDNAIKGFKDMIIDLINA